MQRISGIYAICNHLTGEAYIGESRRVAQRWAQHRIDLLGGRHHDLALQDAWSTGGESVFGLVILERFDEIVSTALQRPWQFTRERRCIEARWLARARSAGIVLYNDQVQRGRKWAA